MVLEALSQGTPAILVRGEDNAATEFIEEGVNGHVVTAEPDELAAAVVRVRDGGEALRGSVLSWFTRNADRLSLRDSLQKVSAAYRRG